MSTYTEDTPFGQGFPRPDTILKEEVFTPTPIKQMDGTLALDDSPNQPTTVYQILITNQMDGYDKPLPQEELAMLASPRDDTPADRFRGTARRAAKTSIANAPIEEFTDLKALIDTLPTKQIMTSLQPKISEGPQSDRRSLEKRNVRVKAFLYAASLENDNDYHLIIGRVRNSTPFQCMNVEISGLPSVLSSSFTRLNKARTDYKTFFGERLPGKSYSFYSPPIPVIVEGSLFFDVTHATGTPPGPRDLRPFIPTIWEIHPISNIVFEP